VSPRISQLTQELHAGHPEALSQFWADVRAHGTPLVEPFDGQVNEGRASRARPDDCVLVTFLWKESFETYNVRVQWPQDRPDDFFMSRLAGTDVWYKTVLVRRGSRLSYSLLPNDRPADEALNAQRDPLNPRLAWDDYPEYSLLELEGAPDEWFRKTPAARGTVSAQQQFQSELLKGPRTITIYTPPGYSASGGPYPFLLLFDGITYQTGFEAVPTLDNLISSGRIRPVIVCFLRNAGTRAADLGPNPTFGDAMARELLPWLRTSYPISTDPKDIIIGGYSAGGSGAAYIAFRHPGTFGNVLSQSGGFGSAGRLDTNPAILAYRDTDRLPIRFYLDVGLYENAFEEFPVNEQALAEGLTNGNRHFRDVLLAKGYDVTYRETGGQHNNLHFRATFPEALLALLAPRKP
jgi:enterochelin esterase family protein